MRQSFLLKFTLIYTVLVFCSASCLKKDPEPAKELPPITTTGEQTFGCLVNGEVWLPHSDNSWQPMHARWVKNDSTFAISMDINKHNQGGLLESVDILIYPFHGIDSYPLLVRSNGYYSRYKENKVFLTKIGPGGSVQILKHDSIKNILSGTFYFTAIDTIYKDTITVTDGRFDLIYYAE